ncbi:MAG: tRNA epoxyqueuosine(34) reductase QueG [Vulcanibacillus sp.]
MDTNSMGIKQKLINYAYEIGIDKIGFTSATPFYELKQVLTEHRQLGYDSGFEEKDLEKRIDPKQTLKNAESIIAIAIAYPNKFEIPLQSTEELRGFISCSAWGLDYHIILEDKLSKLGDFLKEIEPKTEYVFMTDTGPLSDKAVAERSGLGWIGKNSLLITPEYGSYVFLGEMITNIKIPEDKPIKEQCGECTLCIDACPNNAIVQAKQLNSKKCLSYITQKKNISDEDLIENLKNRLYGCDTCQQVCPINKGIKGDNKKFSITDLELIRPLLKPLLNITSKEFNKKWGTTAAGWRGKTIIQRNAIMGLAYYKDISAITELKKMLIEDRREVIRQTAAWAIGEIGGEVAKETLYFSKKGENNPKVLQEIDKSLNKLLNQ